MNRLYLHNCYPNCAIVSISLVIEENRWNSFLSFSVLAETVPQRRANRTSSLHLSRLQDERTPRYTLHHRAFHEFRDGDEGALCCAARSLDQTRRSSTLSVGHLITNDSGLNQLFNTLRFYFLNLFFSYVFMCIFLFAHVWLFYFFFFFLLITGWMI